MTANADLHAIQVSERAVGILEDGAVAVVELDAELATDGAAPVELEAVALIDKDVRMRRCVVADHGHVVGNAATTADDASGAGGRVVVNAAEVVDPILHVDRCE